MVLGIFWFYSPGVQISTDGYSDFRLFLSWKGFDVKRLSHYRGAIGD